MELDSTISRLKTNMMLGSDGFMSNGIKYLERNYLHHFGTLSVWLWQGSKLPLSWKEAVISVIPKELEIKNSVDPTGPFLWWTKRSSLQLSLNDFRTLCWIWLIRVNQVLSGVGRTRIILHLTDQVQKQGLRAILVCHNAEKAFYCVNWPFLYMVLQKFSFQKQLIECIQSLYQEPTTR